ncbi:Vanillate O-demethylase oxidoreductase [Cupriavidus taiwanensis]|uniref:Vanillate O-demethylase oxidoreductase n=1 Tax=Cupriavidus taiwanensis TaxID=164546 RepID=A0A976AR85_9BURK|nr:PDR/VanB family oxidoreductase [Cupriavidus taiwanensis]SOY97460.1 Vanillate O-demethylase oxidoreductase [Cupriavidus taiwanensis]SOZ00190.1 Vanillate O-demethylase oxidoreductase [Cupriavidus taiwanensis]SPD68139.1 Vanillate O-demethylase oxidoreductase [Cupriavidus taiwanensis]
MNAPLAERATLTHLELVLRQVRMEATGINSYEFVDADGNDLPAFTAGAHIDVHIAPGVIRQYSLCNSPEERHRYVVAVLRDEAGRGGSRGMHETLHVPNRVRISVPRNNFPLAEGAKKIIMLAGGIGVTPLKAMVHRLESKRVDYELHYCAKGPQYAAFESELRSIARIGHIHCHFDGGDPKKGLNIAKLLKHPEADTHIYYCGPGGFMQACADAAAHWPSELVHCEHFKAPVQKAPTTSDTPVEGYVVELARSEKKLTVAPDQNLAEVLQQAGAPVETSCQSGLCGTCKVRYLAGEVDHQDFILDESERQTVMTPCVSRCSGGTLVLDL